MDLRSSGAIDCDIHPAVPSLRVLRPYLDPYWREQVPLRGLGLLDLDLTASSLAAPASSRPDWRPAKGGLAASALDLVQRQALDAFGTRFAICNVTHGAQALFQPYMAAMLCRAINDWIAAEWLDREPRLRASIMIPAQEPELAVEEIERRAGDSRFVQVLMLVMGDMPLGRRHFWPIYRAAERHELAIGIIAGSSYRFAPTPIGWPSSYLGDYVAYGNGFDNAVLSLIAEGVFAKFPRLRVVLIQSGVTWLPAFLWRANKTWRGVRAEIPWVERPPSDYVREHIRLTVQPFDAPADRDAALTIVDQLGSDRMLLFSTDYPHWQFEGEDALPAVFEGDLARKILVENPLETYPRLKRSLVSPRDVSPLEERAP